MTYSANMSLPICEVCKKLNGIERAAKYEALTYFGFYAFMCETHLQKHAVSGKKLKNKVAAIQRQHLQDEFQWNQRQDLLTEKVS
ncbi:MAG: hypothetical protein ACE5NG_00270 [bacterium]